MILKKQITASVQLSIKKNITSRPYKIIKNICYEVIRFIRVTISNTCTLESPANEPVICKNPGSEFVKWQ